MKDKMWDIFMNNTSQRTLFMGKKILSPSGICPYTHSIVDDSREVSMLSGGKSMQTGVGELLAKLSDLEGSMMM